MNPKLDKLANEVLTQLELKESGMLSWGFIGAFINVFPDVQEILDTPPTESIKNLWEELSASGEDAHTIINNLKDRKLLLMRSDGLGRTRYAETIRLLYQLKQRFSFEDWSTAANLVSSMRLSPRYRKYPRRDVEWSSVRGNLLSKNVCDEFTLGAIDLLLGKGAIKLSNFQVRSLEILIDNTSLRYDRAVIIGAGTGSGKTKAFYLPAISRICDELRTDDSHYARVIALYPRNELLKDQYKEAISEICKLNDYLKEKGIRPIVVGSYYGDIPPLARQVKEEGFYKWKEGGRGYVCPSLMCPQCNSDLLWMYEDLEAEIRDNENHRYGRHEVLHCSNEDCGFSVDGENVVLTRKRMQETPPDILFTTTEMLNRKLFDTSDQHVFGVNTAKVPKFVLLDEVHINEGILGAHVAYLLRRWRNLARVSNPQVKVQYVGLSATLSEPKAFFSNMTGLDESNTIYITPAEDELEAEGIEYNVVLRGDPMSEKSLLSTSVQTAMLLGRILDPTGKDVSQGAYGTKTFAFTDKLDVLNRWYHIEKDAEGPRKLLSKYRDPDLVKSKMPRSMSNMHKAGQVWNMAHSIDEDSLKKPLAIGVTSSQSKGVDPNARLVIATSTLEVGFNDPNVGAVIQHKAPRNMASFLQRKGRGGRMRGMRPWTVPVSNVQFFCFQAVQTSLKHFPGQTL